MKLLTDPNIFSVSWKKFSFIQTREFFITLSYSEILLLVQSDSTTVIKALIGLG